MQAERGGLADGLGGRAGWVKRKGGLREFRRRRPHRPAVVKRLRRSSASLRPLRGHDAGPMRLCCIQELCCRNRQSAGFGSKALGRQTPEPSGGVKVREATGEAGSTLTPST